MKIRLNKQFYSFAIVSRAASRFEEEGLGDFRIEEQEDIISVEVSSVSKDIKKKELRDEFHNFLIILNKRLNHE